MTEARQRIQSCGSGPRKGCRHAPSTMRHRIDSRAAIIIIDETIPQDGAVAFRSGKVGKRSPMQRDHGALGRDLAIGVACAAAAVALRLAIKQRWAGVAPFTSVFPALVAATLLASWRAGLVTIIVSQLAIWFYIVPPQNSFALPAPASAVSLVLATTSQLLLLGMLHLFQQARKRVAELDALRIADLELAMEELDHRTMNDFQLAIAILRSQAGRSSDAIEAAIGRLHVVATVHRRLQHEKPDLRSRGLDALIAEILVAGRAHAAALPDVAIVSALDRVDVPAEHALRAGLIVNELVMNALKYAFPDGKGRIDIGLSAAGPGYVLTVSDTGCGRGDTARPGSGSRLVPMMAKSIGGVLAYGDGPGVTVTLTVASIAWRD